MSNTDRSQHTSPRAQRFHLQLQLRYRVCGETAWLIGLIEDISYSGVFFWAEQPLQANTPIEMSFEIPGEVDCQVGAEIVCKGEIVRSVLPAEGGPRAALAARILQYQFVRGQKRCAA
jgi:hypothetical protein